MCVGGEGRGQGHTIEGSRSQGRRAVEERATIALHTAGSGQLPLECATQEGLGSPCALWVEWQEQRGSRRHWDCGTGRMQLGQTWRGCGGMRACVRVGRTHPTEELLWCRGRRSPVPVLRSYRGLRLTAAVGAAPLAGLCVTGPWPVLCFEHAFTRWHLDLLSRLGPAASTVGGDLCEPQTRVCWAGGWGVHCFWGMQCVLSSVLVLPCRNQNSSVVFTH